MGVGFEWRLVIWWVYCGSVTAVLTVVFRAGLRGAERSGVCGAVYVLAVEPEAEELEPHDE